MDNDLTLFHQKIDAADRVWLQRRTSSLKRWRTFAATGRCWLSWVISPSKRAPAPLRPNLTS